MAKPYNPMVEGQDARELARLGGLLHRASRDATLMGHLRAHLVLVIDPRGAKPRLELPDLVGEEAAAFYAAVREP